MPGYVRAGLVRPVPRPDARAPGRALGPLRRVAHEDWPTSWPCSAGRVPPRKRLPTVPTTQRIAPTGIGADEQVLGSGCVHPAATQTLVGQLAAKHLELARHTSRVWTNPALRWAPAGTRRSGEPDNTAHARAVCHVHQPVCVSSFGDRLRDVRERRRGARPAGLRSGRREPHAELLLHRAQPLRRRRHPTPCTRAHPPAWCRPRNSCRRSSPEILRSKAYKSSGLLVTPPTRRPRAANSRTPAPAAVNPPFPTWRPPRRGRPRSARRWGGRRAAALAVHQGSRHRARNRTTLSRCCARSRICSA